MAKHIGLFTLSILMIMLSIIFLDKPIAIFIDNRAYSSLKVFHWMQLPPEWIYYLSIPGFIYLAIYLIQKKQREMNHHSRFLYCLIVGVLFTWTTKTILKYVFGRTWPITFDGSQALIQHGVHEFSFFHGGLGHSAFPSGHSAIIFMTARIIWPFYPKLRWMACTFCLMAMVGLLGKNYHFLGDILAGAVLGYYLGKGSLQLLFAKKAQCPRGVLP